MTVYKGALEIIKIYAVLPCSNTEVEHSFSTMNRINIDIRNQLLLDVLEDLRMTSMNGNDLKVKTMVFK